MDITPYFFVFYLFYGSYHDHAINSLPQWMRTLRAIFYQLPNKANLNQTKYADQSKLK